jgi:hypothetical protein
MIEPVLPKGILKPTGCIEWPGAPDAKGYGRIRRGGRLSLVHRVSYQQNVGDPGELLVCHKCDNPICLNPEHLFLGTHADNVDDRERKGRGSDKRCDKNPNARLTIADVLDIRNRAAAGESYWGIAKTYGMQAANIRRVACGIHWKDAPGPLSPLKTKVGRRKSMP